MGKFYLTNLISFYDKATHLVDQEKPVGVIYFGVSKYFNSFSHSLSYSGWKVWHTAKQVHNTLGEKLVDKSGSKSYSKWDHIKLVAQHSLDSSVLNLMASAL